MSPVFFDLDHTLWDFETNSRETLDELLLYFQQEIAHPISIDAFFPIYSLVNLKCWELYRKHEITQAELRINRFTESFETCGVQVGSWIQDFAASYTRECPKKGSLFPGALETVQALSEKLPLFIITNGFEEVQKIKLEYSGLKPFFKEMITSETAGFRKPDIRIFNYALKQSGSSRRDHFYIGDDYEADMLGAKAAGMKPVYFNPQKKDNPAGFQEIASLSELLYSIE